MSETKKEILVADDDEGILDVIDIILEDAGYNVTTTSRGEEVFELEKKLPDLILLDISMAGIDGREICKHLKDQFSTKHIPVILISASSDIKEIAAQAGADDYIPKPFDMNEFLEKVAKYLEDKIPEEIPL